MKTLLSTEVRNRWKEILREVAEGEEEIRIHAKGDREVVMLASDLYESLLATIETLSDPRAMKAIRGHRRGKDKKTYDLAAVDRLLARRA